MSNESIAATIAGLQSIRSSGTKLISFYTPSSTEFVNRSKSKIKQELSQCSNIKDSSTKQSVKKALGQIRAKLHEFKRKELATKYPNGLALFCGDSYKVQVLPLLAPIQRIHYQCDRVFDLSPISEQMQSECEDHRYGVILIDGSSFCVGEVKGSRSTILQSKSVNLKNKTKKGGWSQKRYERLYV